jgi:hypothetical protein
MAKHLPFTHFPPINFASIGGDSFPVAEPRFPKPVSPANDSMGIRKLKDDNRYTRCSNGRNSKEFSENKEIIEPCTCSGANTIRYIHDDQNEYGEEFMFSLSGLASYACCREDAFYENNAQNCKRCWHNGNNPCPGCEEPKNLAKYILKIWLHAA